MSTATAVAACEPRLADYGPGIGAALSFSVGRCAEQGGVRVRHGRAVAGHAARHSAAEVSGSGCGRRRLACHIRRARG